MTIHSLDSYFSQLNFMEDNLPNETLRAPWIVLMQNAGDCDDVAIFAAFWARANGYSWKWILMGKKENGEFNIYHIATQIGSFLLDPFGSKDYIVIEKDKWRS